MNKLIFSAALILSLGLAACGDSKEENLSGTTNNSEDTTETDVKQEEESKEDSNEINELIVDNEHVKATLIKIVKKNDETWGNSYEVVFDIENKRSDSIEVQARSISADGRMVDETITSMSQEVAPGKTAQAKLTISELEGYEFPELNSDFEMTLHVFSWANYEWYEDHPVKVSF